MEVVWRFETFYVGALRVKLNVLACQGVLKSLALNEPHEIGCSFMQIQTLLPRIHHERKQIIDNVCKTTNAK